jgi:hypothetical protein
LQAFVGCQVSAGNIEYSFAGQYSISDIRDADVTGFEYMTAIVTLCVVQGYTTLQECFLNPYRGTAGHSALLYIMGKLQYSARLHHRIPLAARYKNMDIHIHAQFKWILTLQQHYGPCPFYWTDPNTKETIL